MRVSDPDAAQLSAQTVRSPGRGGAAAGLPDTMRLQEQLRLAVVAYWTRRAAPSPLEAKW